MTARKPKLKPEFELAKRLPGRSQMERVQAARAYISGCANAHNQTDLELHAFMAIFHPEVPTQTVREMSRDARSSRR